jgi:alpha-tubulin suppressor-like RCC1 family protein
MASRSWHRLFVAVAATSCVFAAQAAIMPFSGFALVKGGIAFNVALRTDGSVWAWGDNSVGQLGDGTLTPSLTPKPVSCGEAAGDPNHCSAEGHLRGAVGVAAGNVAAVVLLDNGSVLAWGFNSSFYNATDATTPAYVVCGAADPAHCAGGVLAKAIQVAVGFSHSLVLLDDGAVLAWGTNNNGNLGNNQPAVPSATPVQVSGLTSGSGVTTVTAGQNFSFALKSDGTVVGWGTGGGVLGDGTTVAKATPVPVKCGVFTGNPAFCTPDGLLRGVVSMAAGNGVSFALLADGSMAAWGTNASGQLGDGTTTNRSAPVFVCAVGAAAPCAGASVLNGVSQLVGSSLSSSGYALMANGAVLAWGSNGSGQLGDGTTTLRTTPIQVSGLGAASAVSSIAAGDAHALALMADGTALAWGSDTNGQLGRGTISGIPIPVQPIGLGTGSGAISLASRAQSTLTLRSDGTVLAWGSNANGQLGDGTLDNQNTPVSVACRVGDAPGSAFCSGTGQLRGVSEIARGVSHSLAVLVDGTVLTWGANTNGQLGDGTTTQRLRPVNVCAIGATPPCSVANGNALQGVSAVSGSGTTSFARTSAGLLLAWGNNGNGFLGDGTNTQKAIPVNVKCRAGDPLGTTFCSAAGYLQGVSAIGSGSNASMAIMNDGTLLAWGLNLANQLGDGTAVNRNLPVNVCAVGATAPCTVAGGNVLQGVVAVAGAGNGGFALTVTGSMLAWGTNNGATLGDGTTINRSVPVNVCAAGAVAPCNAANGNTLEAVSTVASGLRTAYAVRSDGTVLGWGTNGSGQIGDGTYIARFAPVPVAGLGSGSDVIAIAAGAASAAALKLDGTVLSWGANGVGELGDGTTYPANLLPGPILFDDTTPPQRAVVASPDHLWPPNRQKVEVRIQVTASDDFALPAQPVTALTISVNEPGEPPVIAQPAGFVFDPGSIVSGRSETKIVLIAQRGVSGNVRVYTITGAVRDASGNSTPFSAAIPVAPH